MSESINRRNMLGLALAAPIAAPIAIAGLRERALACGGFIPGLGVTESVVYLRMEPFKIPRAYLDELSIISRRFASHEIVGGRVEDQMLEHDLFDEVEA